MAEQLPLKQFVEGSSPPGVTIKNGLSSFWTAHFLFKTKCNRGIIKGLKEVETEWGILSINHNIRKLAALGLPVFVYCAGPRKLIFSL